MFQTGIFTGYFPYGLDEVASRIRGHGFNTVQLDFAFKDMDLSYGQFTKAKTRQVRDTFRNHNLPICCISGYTNIIHPDLTHRKANMDRLKEIIRWAREFGTPYVISETGTYNTESEWMSDPKNKSEEGFDICAAAIEELSREAYDHGAVFCLETYVNNVVGSVEETVRMFARVNHPGLGLLADPTNYFEDHNIDNMDGVLNQVFDTLGDKIVMAHAKDVARSKDATEKHADIDATSSHTFRGVGGISLDAPGMGVLNYDLYLKRLAQMNPNIPIIIEHLSEDDVVRSKTFLEDKMRAQGL